MIKQVEAAVEETIRPHLKSHNGDIKILEVNDGIVKIKLFGACSGCPHSDITTKDFIEEKLREKFTWFKEVIISREVSQELIDMARSILNKTCKER